MTLQDTYHIRYEIHEFPFVTKRPFWVEEVRGVTGGHSVIRVAVGPFVATRPQAERILAQAGA